MTTLEDETSAVGPILFSLTKTGVYTNSIGPIAVPASFWIKSHDTVIELKKTTPIVVTADLYL